MKKLWELARENTRVLGLVVTGAVCTVINVLLVVVVSWEVVPEVNEAVKLSRETREMAIDNRGRVARNTEELIRQGKILDRLAVVLDLIERRVEETKKKMEDKGFNSSKQPPKADVKARES